jgi:Putative Ig domain
MVAMASTTKLFIAVLFVTCVTLNLSGCDSDGNVTTTPAASSSSGTGSATSSTALSISGTPARTVAAGTAYNFRPATTGATGTSLTFTVGNKPAWAAFDKTTGTLSGTPASANMGVAAQIEISVSDGTNTAALAPFSITVAASGTASLAISGSPATSVAVGSAYSFRPTVTDAVGSALSFTISNKPSWAAFSTTTGALSGTPGTSNAGTDAKIEISVSDGKASAALTAFSIAVGSSASEAVTLYWTVPADNSNGTPATNLAGYHVYYGKSAASLTTVITVDDANDTSQVIGNLQSGTWYFAVTAFNAEKIESKMSEVVPLTIS